MPERGFVTEQQSVRRRCGETTCSTAWDGATLSDAAELYAAGLSLS